MVGNKLIVSVFTHHWLIRININKTVISYPNIIALYNNRPKLRA